MAAADLQRRNNGSVGSSAGMSARSSKRILKNFNPNAPPAPSIVLRPLNDSFTAKRLDLLEPIKIGRQVSAKTVPTEANGYFDSKVLSRAHAEIWADNGRVFVKDVKSSNGTFLNAERLSREGEESEPRELHPGDVLEFGTDIPDEDGSVLYKKVSCKVSIVEMEFPQAPGTSSLPRGVQAGKEPASAPPPVPERPNEQTIRSLNLDALYGQLQTDLRRSKEAAAGLEQAKAALGKLPNQTAEVKELERKLAEATEKINRVSNEHNQVQRALAEYRQTAASERDKLIEEKNTFRAERDRAVEEVALLKTQVRQAEEAAVAKKLRESSERSAGAAVERRKGEEVESLRAQIAELSAQLEQAPNTGSERRKTAAATDTDADRELKTREAERAAGLAQLEDDFAVLQEKHDELQALNATLRDQVSALGKEKALLEEDAPAPRKTKDKAAPLLRRLFAMMFGGGPLSLSVVGISVAVGALGMWAYGFLSSTTGRAITGVTAAPQARGGSGSP